MSAGTRSLLWLAWSLSGSAPTAGSVSDPQAQALVAEAQAAFDASDFDTSAAKLERAFGLEPIPTLLYPWAQAERARGNCTRAIELYQRFLDSGPPQRTAEYARQNIERCRQPDEPEVTPEAAPAEVPPSPVVVTTDPVPQVRDVEPDPPARRAWMRDPAGASLFGGGLAVLTVGAVLLGVASGQAGRIDDEPRYDDYLEERSRVTAMRNAGLVLASVGGACVVAGIARYTWVWRKDRRAVASLWIDPVRGSVGWSGRF